ncbi:MAG: PqqD family protein [bacterium]|nr:PqqD family protein [bacterium]
MTVRVAFIGDSHLAPLVLAAGSMDLGRLRPTFFADVLQQLRHLQVSNGCLHAGDENQRRRFLETSGGSEMIDPKRFDLFILMGLGFEFPFDCMWKQFYSQAVVEQTIRDQIPQSLAFSTLMKLRRVTDRPVWLLHKPLFDPSHSKQKLQVITYAGFLALADEVFRLLSASVLSQPEETRIDDHFSFPELSRSPVSIDNHSGETRPVESDGHHKNEAFGQAVVRDLRARLDTFQPDEGAACDPWRPRKLGAIHRSDSKQLLLRLDGRRDALQLNPTAAKIWELCDGTRTQEVILAEFSKLYAAPGNLFLPDLRETLCSFVEFGALEFDREREIHAHDRGGERKELADSLHISTISQLPDLRFCHNCPDLEIRHRFIEVVEEIGVGNVFNPSFFENGDVRIFAFRAIPDKSGELVSFVSVEDISGRTVNRISPDLYEGIKAPRLIDPKVFTVGNEVYLTFNSGWVPAGNDIFVMKIIPTIGTPKKVIYGARQRQERNWGFFSEGGEIYAIYQIAPLVILKLERESSDTWWMADDIRQTGADIPHDLTLGTQPFKHEDRYYFMAHRKYVLKGKKVYLGRPCVLNLDKLKVTMSDSWMAHSPESLLGNERKHNTNLFSCTYFSGLQVSASGLTLGYGINDVDFGFSTYPMKEFLK